MIRLYNSYTRELEEFIPQKSREVSMYTCGPTVYDKAHLGNFRTAFFSDLVARVLKFNSYYVKNVMNITDLDDKIEQAALESKLPVKELTKKYTDYYLESLKKLNIQTPWRLTFATEYIKEMQFLIQVLLEKGIAYQISDGIYFNISKYPEYYKLSNQDPNKLDRARIDENKDKINPHDFALWKFSTPTEKRLLDFDTPWGKGYPGWHIECSAMALKELGDTLDIHIGGEDLKMTHHPNEIAQSECVTGERFVNYWLHAAFLNINSEKMSKSLGNFITLDELLSDDTNPIALRYYFLSSTYRNPLNLTDEGLIASKNALKRAYDMVASLKVDDSYKYDEVMVGKFLDALNNDFNTPAALGIFWETITSTLPETVKLNSLIKMDEVLGLDLIKYVGYDIPMEVLELGKLRWEYKKQGIYDKADFMRREIEKLGFEVLDQKDNYQLKKVFK